MIQTQLSFFDASVVGILLLSCIFAFFRGFVREVLSLGAWIGAGLVTVYYFPQVSEALRPHFKKEIGAVGISTLGIYTVSLLCFSLINMVIMKFVKSGSDVGMLDNMLGLFFGAFRGVVIISLAFFLFTIAVHEKDYPKWITESKTYPYVEKSATLLASVAPEYLREISTLHKKAAPNSTSPSDIDIHSETTSSTTQSTTTNSGSALSNLLSSHSEEKEGQ